jgi:hypothetical protein
VLADGKSGVPRAVAVRITVAGSRLEVAELATRNTSLSCSDSRSNHAEGVGRASVHVSDKFTSGIANSGTRETCSPLAVLVVVTRSSGAGAERAASLAASAIVAQTAHRFLTAFCDGEGISNVDVDVGACSSASLNSDVPHAARIGDASGLILVHDRAVTDTTEGGLIPSAKRRADTIVGVVDGVATDTTGSSLGIPFALAVSVTLIRSRAEFALELADTSDTVSDTVISEVAITSVRTLSVAGLLDGVPEASGGFSAHGVLSDGRALGAADLIGHAPLAAVVALDVAAEEVAVSESASSVASVSERTDGERTHRIEDQLTSTVGLTLINIESRAVSHAGASAVVPQAVTSGGIGVARNKLVEGVLALIQASRRSVDAARFNSAFEFSVDGCAEGRALETAIIPDTFNISTALILVVPAIVTFLLASSRVPDTSLANQVAFGLSVTASARLDASVLNDVPHTFSIEVARTRSNPTEFAALGALTGRSELANGVAGTGDVGGDTERWVEVAAATADVHDTVPFAHGAGSAGRGFSGQVAGFVANLGLSVPLTVAIETAEINIRAVSNVAARAASVVGVVEYTETSESEAHGGAESFALLTADHVVCVPHAATISVTSSVVEVAESTGLDTSGGDCPLASAVGEATLGCLPLRAVLFAVVRGRVPRAAWIEIARSLLSVLDAADARAPLTGGIPVADRIDGASVHVSDHRAVSLADGASRIPDTFSVRVATHGVVVSEAALLAAEGTVPSAHCLAEASLLNDERIADGEFDGVDG